MIATLKGIVVFLVLFSFTPQGVRSLDILHYEVFSAVVGEDVSLPCTPKETLKILQIEWKKKEENEEQRLVLYNPQYGEIISSAAVELRSENDRVMKTTLVLKAVNETDSGRYICDLTTYPNGSIRKVTRLKVKDLDDIIKCYANRTKAETGQNVTVNCTADGFPRILFRWTKDNKWISNEASLVLWSVSKHDAGLYTLTVSVGNNTALVRQRRFNISVLPITTQSDKGPATTPSTLTSTGTQRTGPTGTTGEASTPTEPGRGKNLTVTPDPLTPRTDSFLQTATVIQPRNFTTPEVNSSFLQTATVIQPRNFTTPEVNSSFLQTATVIQPRNFTTPEVNSSFLQTATVIQPRNFTIELFINTKEQVNSSTNNPMRVPTTGGSGKHTSVSHGSGMVIEKGSQRYATILWIFPFLVVLLLVAILYRRYVIQKRIDTPPPFKPPPPPVKYSSVKAQETPMTDIII